MDGHVLYVVGAFLGTLLVVLAVWQSRISRAETARVVEEIQESHKVGTHKPLSQHPQIQPELCIGCGSCVAACPEEGVLGLVDGVAHVIHGSRCIGHGRCAEACPVGALTVGLGELASRSDIPLLSDDLETTVPGIFIAGELGGISLIRNAVEQGTRAVEAVARRLAASRAPAERGVVDLLIAGAGPAGLAAALKAVERKLSYVAIDQEDTGGTVRKYPRRKLTMTQPFELPLYGRVRRSEYLKEELIELWDGIVMDFGLSIRKRVRLLGVRRSGACFEVETSDGNVRSRCVLLALGRRGTPRKLGVPGEESERVLYQLIDAATYTNQRLLVVGGGDSAIEAATALANQPGNEVVISYRKPSFFRLKSRNEQRIAEYVRARRVRAVFSSEVKAFEEGSAILEVDGEGGSPEAAAKRLFRVPSDYTFVFAGGEPPFPILRSMGVGFGSDPRGNPAEPADPFRRPAVEAVA